MKPIDNEDDRIQILGGANWHGDQEDKTRLSGGDGKKIWVNKKVVVSVVVAVILILFSGIYFYQERRRVGFNYPLSRTQTEVIDALVEPVVQKTAGVEASEDSILGVALKLYKISGLKAELAFGVPNLEDENIYLVTRNADYRYDKEQQVLIGDYIDKGKELARQSWRAGYFAILNGHAEIGVGRHSDMRDYILDHEGSMFRQLALVSAGIKCIAQYELKGKVTRSAYARMPNNDLYYVETKMPETLFGFSDALIEYGFVDAIYITGGAQLELFFRDDKGVSLGRFVDDKKHYMVVWKKKL